MAKAAHNKRHNANQTDLQGKLSKTLAHQILEMQFKVF